MTEHKFTDDEIIKALEHCQNREQALRCIKCEYVTGCKSLLIREALDLINRQRAEIEDLEIKNEHLACFLAEARRDAFKEFAERLKEEGCFYSSMDAFESIDNLVKEMVGEG